LWVDGSITPTGTIFDYHKTSIKKKPLKHQSHDIVPALQDRLVACVGPWYLRLLHRIYAEGDDHHGVLLDVSDTVDEDEEESEVEFEDDIEFLRSLDPKEWKVCCLYKLNKKGQSFKQE
jgi:hypothetical protein